MYVTYWKLFLLICLEVAQRNVNDDRQEERQAGHEERSEADQVFILKYTSLVGNLEQTINTDE